MFNFKTSVTDLAASFSFSPFYIIFFLSDQCWMKCRHCWFNEEWQKRNIVKQPLSYEEIEKTASSIHNPLFISLCGGEAFMRDDIVDLTAMLLGKTKMKRYQIPTSGFDTDKIIKSTERILQQNKNVPFRVDVSLDGLEATHDFIRGRDGSFKAAVQTIKELVKIKKNCQYFDMGIMSTVNKYNQDQVHELGQFVSEISGGGEWMVKILRGSPRDPGAGDVSPEKYFQVHEIINSQLYSKKIQGHCGHFSASLLSAKNAVRRKIIYKIHTENYYPGICSAASLICVVNVDGEVRPCEMLDNSIGNLRDNEYNLKKILTSQVAHDFRHKVIKEQCRCTHECVLSTSILLQPKQMVDLALQWVQFYKQKVRIPGY